MEAQTLPLQSLTTMHCAVAERGIANRQIIALWELGTREILTADPLVRIELARDTGRDGIVLNAGKSDLTFEFFWACGDEEPRATSRFKHRTAPKPHTLSHIPQRVNNQFRCVVDILCGALQASPFSLRRKLFKFCSKTFPSLAYLSACWREKAVGQFTSTKARKTGQHVLLCCRGVSILAFKCREQGDRCDVCFCTRFPALSQTTYAIQTKISLWDAEGLRGGE
ncbi:hypothetical protein NBRC3188_3089 [Acetobacter pasteurianus NBRC 3188]|uniref:Uncharacterized protein n=1 Tax=Acetobacter pasteurianus NBRC 3188 TaxID=1226663 RepID=A0A401WYE2_ACEPA|nr:hypothetical protein NBRC3188_3089 [Acetobacter pasteurianus NBRC 3188]